MKDLDDLSTVETQAALTSPDSPIYKDRNPGVSLDQINSNEYANKRLANSPFHNLKKRNEVHGTSKT